jgi:hypothetical protein
MLGSISLPILYLEAMPQSSVRNLTAKCSDSDSQIPFEDYVIDHLERDLPVCDDEVRTSPTQEGVIL